MPQTRRCRRAVEKQFPRTEITAGFNFKIHSDEMPVSVILRTLSTGVVDVHQLHFSVILRAPINDYDQETTKYSRVFNQRPRLI